MAPEFRAVEILDYQHIKEGERLGSGQFGEVFKGEAKLQGKDQWTVVAIKKPKGQCSFRNFFVGDTIYGVKATPHKITILAYHARIRSIRWGKDHSIECTLEN